MAEAALDFFNGADLPSLPVAVQAECLQAWSRLEAKRAAAEAGLIAAFWASDGPAADGQQSVTAWLTRFTRCTKTAARGQIAASFRVRGHAHVGRALAAGEISASYGRWIGDVTKRFDPQDRDAVEQILVEAAANGALVEDLEQLAVAALRRLAPGGPSRDDGQAHADRGLTLAKTFGGVGRLNGDLDVEATALAEAVIGALSTKMGPEDDRTARQRRHDALAEAFRRLIASNLLPERGGAKPHLKVDVDLATLRNLPGAPAAEDEWVARQMAALTRARLGGATTRDLLAASPTGPTTDQTAGQLAAFAVSQAPLGPREVSQPALPGLGDMASLAGVGPIGDRLAAGLACDSIITPTVLAAVDRDALDAMTDEWLHAHGLPHRDGLPECDGLRGHVDLPDRDDRDDRDGGPRDRDDRRDRDGLPERDDRRDRDGPRGHNGLRDRDGLPDRDGCRGCGSGGGDCGDGATGDRGGGLTDESFLRLRQTMLRWAIRALSGPGGLGAYLRTRVLDGPLATPSILLDVGADDRTVPAPLDRAVRRRDKRCRFPGCDQAAELSQVHHIQPRSGGGATELWNLVSTCSFHHLIAVHTWGWQLRLNPDGTTTATGPDGRVLHEHDPPLRAA